jgi:hypothetical protein
MVAKTVLVVEDDPPLRIYRCKRLRLRCEQYQKIVPELYNRIMDAQHPNWKKAQTTAPELIERYKKTCSALRLEPPIG